MNVDYEELEMAMATDPTWDMPYFLDTSTGQVLMADEWTTDKAQDYERFEDLPEGNDHMRLAWVLQWEEGEGAARRARRNRKQSAAS
jgi:hypothetical protein